MPLHDDFKSIADSLPREAAVLLPIAVFLRLIGEPQAAESTPSKTSQDHEVDLTIPEAARLFGRGKSTIRSWCASGLIPGCYRLRGREWRIPRQGLSAFLEGQRNRIALAQTLACGNTVDLAAWRGEKSGIAPARAASAA